MINEIAEVLPPFLDISQCTKVKFAFRNGTSVHHTKMATVASTVISQGGSLEGPVMTFMIDPNNQTSGKDILTRIRINDSRERAQALRETVNDRPESVDIWDLSVYIEATRKKDMHFLVDPITKRVVKSLTYQAWKEVVGTDIVAEARKQIARVEYNPTTLTATRDETYEENRDTAGMTVFNTYYAPDWKMRRSEGASGKLHPILKTFFENFIPDLACREYVFERMMMIADGRLPIILVMNTLTGTGKGLFVESILRYGVGKDNWIAAPKSWDKSGFNSWMDSKQIVWFDEEKVMPDGDAANTNYLKRLANDHQSIEKKGHDVTGVTKVFTSLILTNNQGTKNFRLEEDNRRFSVVDVGFEKMSMIYGEDEAERIANAIVNNEDNMLGDFWLWLSENYSTQNYGNPFTLWKGPTYKMFLYESRSLWQKTIIDMCKAGDVTKIYRTDIKTEFESRKDPSSRIRFPKVGTVIGFLNEFTEDSQRLGVFHKPADTADREWWIEVNDYWLKEETKKEEKLGLKEVHLERTVEDDTAERIANLEDDFELDL